MRLITLSARLAPLVQALRRMQKSVQGYLAHKKMHPPRTLLQAYA